MDLVLHPLREMGKKAYFWNTSNCEKTGLISQGTIEKAEETKHGKAAVIDAVENIEPGEMSLEKIEGRMGSLFREDCGIWSYTSY